jgi:hypothetical protein
MVLTEVVVSSSSAKVPELTEVVVVVVVWVVASLHVSSALTKSGGNSEQLDHPKSGKSDHENETGSEVTFSFVTVVDCEFADDGGAEEVVVISERGAFSSVPPAAQAFLSEETRHR